MKILFVHCCYKFKGGEDTVVEEEKRLLLSEGHEVELLLFSNSGNDFLKLFQLPFNVSSYRRTRKMIRRVQPDIVHLHNLHFAASPSVLYACRRSNVPFVQTLHNYRLLCPSATLFFDGKLFLESLRQEFPWTAIKRGVYKTSRLLTFWLSLAMWLHRKIGTWKLSGKYIVLTENFKTILMQSNLKLKNNQVVVKANFCTAPTSLATRFGKHFLYVGRLTVEKGILLLLETFSKVDFEIRIAGDGPLKDTVIEYSQRFPNIIFVGPLEKDGVLTELQSCTSLIFPSIWFEGMPLIIIEAYSCGTPVIASKLGAMESMITPGYNGLHFQPGCHQDLAHALRHWVDMSEAEKQSIRKNSKSSYERCYSSQRNLTQLLGIYNEVIHERRAGEVSPAQLPSPLVIK